MISAISTNLDIFKPSCLSC